MLDSKWRKPLTKDWGLTMTMGVKEAMAAASEKAGLEVEEEDTKVEVVEAEPEEAGELTDLTVAQLTEVAEAQPALKKICIGAIATIELREAKERRKAELGASLSGLIEHLPTDEPELHNVVYTKHVTTVDDVVTVGWVCEVNAVTTQLRPNKGTGNGTKRTVEVFKPNGAGQAPTSLGVYPTCVAAIDAINNRQLNTVNGSHADLPNREGNSGKRTLLDAGFVVVNA